MCYPENKIGCCSVDHRWLLILKAIALELNFFLYMSEGFESYASLKDFIKMATFKYAKRIVALLLLFVAFTSDQNAISILYLHFSFMC